MAQGKALSFYIFLVSLFIAALVACNLIFQKFFFWTPFEAWTFELSVGILPYPITFLITDIISEFFGKKWANRAVWGGLLASVFTLLIIAVANAVPATEWSPVNDNTFSHVFGMTTIAVGSSMLAYLIAQLVDVQLFHFWKEYTQGKMLWVRNNFSTMGSQAIDTSTVIALLCVFDVLEWSQFGVLFLNGFLFKVLVALLDTPLFYLVHYAVRRHFNLKPGEMLKIV